MSFLRFISSLWSLCFSMWSTSGVIFSSKTTQKTQNADDIIQRTLSLWQVDFFHSPSLYLCLEFIVISTDNFYVSYQALQGIKRTSQKADQEIENIKIQKQKRKDLCEINLCVSVHFHSYLVLLLLCKIQHFWKQKSVSNGCDKHLCKSGLVEMHLLPKWRVCGSLPTLS